MPGRQAWSARYDLGFTPWDLNNPHPELTRRLSDDPSLGQIAVGRAYVPGCGTGHDALALAAAGWHVTAVDFAPAVESDLRRRLAPFDCEVHIDDALSFESEIPYDVVFEHTFFCALDLEMRPTFGGMVQRLLADTGSFMSIVYPLGKPMEGGGPPWGADPATITDVLGPAFKMTVEAEKGSVPGRRWPHVWAEWIRT